MSVSFGSIGNTSFKDWFLNTTVGKKLASFAAYICTNSVSIKKALSEVRVKDILDPSKKDQVISYIFARCNYSGNSPWEQAKQKVVANVYEQQTQTLQKQKRTQFPELADKINRLPAGFDTDMEAIVEILAEDYPLYSNDELWNLLGSKIQAQQELKSTQFPELVNTINRLPSGFHTDIEEIVQILAEDFPLFSDEEIWNLLGLKLEQGVLSVTLEDLSHQVFDETRWEKLAPSAVASDESDEKNINFLSPPVEIKKELSIADRMRKMFDLSPDIQISEGGRNDIQNYKKLLREVYGEKGEPADQKLKEIEERTVKKIEREYPNIKDRELETKAWRAYQDELIAIEPKRLNVGDPYVATEENDIKDKLGKNMILLFEKDPGIGETISQSLLPQNVTSFQTISTSEIGSKSKKKTHLKTDFIIHLTEGQTTPFSEEVHKYLKTGATISLAAKKQIEGTIDLQTKTIHFKPGHINGAVTKWRVPLFKRTLLSVRYELDEVNTFHPENKLIVTLGEDGKDNPISQTWTPEEFQKVFQDFKWPIGSTNSNSNATASSDLEEKKHAINDLGNQLDLEKFEDEGTFYNPNE